MHPILKKLPKKEQWLFIAVATLSCLTLLNAVGSYSSSASAKEIEEQARRDISTQSPSVDASVFEKSLERPSMQGGIAEEEHRRTLGHVLALPEGQIQRDPFYRSGRATEAMPPLELTLPPMPASIGFVPVIGPSPSVAQQLRAYVRPSGRIILDPNAIDNPFGD